MVLGLGNLQGYAKQGVIPASAAYGSYAEGIRFYARAQKLYQDPAQRTLDKVIRCAIPGIVSATLGYVALRDLNALRARA